MGVSERIVRRIKALLEMSRRGTEHEKEIASQKLKELLEKSNLSVEDFYEQVTEIVWLPYRTSFEKKLLFQIAYYVTGTGKTKYTTRKGVRKLGFDLKRADAIELDRLYSHWRRALKKEFERSYEAFVQVNKIFGESSEESHELTQEEIDEMDEVMKRMSSQTPSRPFLQIE